jgi:uncharacterized SAM-binding protein YcdF (DUF218 family)
VIVRIGAFLLVVWLLGFAWFSLLLPRPLPTDQKTDAVVVLTGGPQRIERALQVLEQGSARRLLISGVASEVKAQELAEIYGRHRLFECCIDLGFRSVDTRSNALETARWVNINRIGSLRLVTSDWHMRRARLELDLAMGPGTRVAQDAVTTHPGMKTLLKEYNKYWLRAFAALIGI